MPRAAQKGVIDNLDNLLDYKCMKKQVKVTVIDGQGGSLGNLLIKNIKKKYPHLHILAIGTNGIATSNMLKAGADGIATGSNPVVVASRTSDIIIGPLGILTADGLLGEINAEMAIAVGRSLAHKIIIPMNKCNVSIAGTEEIGMDRLIKDSLSILKKVLLDLDPNIE